MSNRGWDRWLKAKLKTFIPLSWWRGVRGRSLRELNLGDSTLPSTGSPSPRYPDIFVFTSPGMHPSTNAPRANGLTEDRRVFYFCPLDDDHVHGSNPPGEGADGHVFNVPMSNLLSDRFIADSQREQSPGDMLFPAVLAFTHAQGVEQALCIVRHPVWQPLIRALQERYGWKIIYDCSDALTGSEINNPEMAAREKDLVIKSDLVIATSTLLYEKQHPYNPNCVLIPNGVDSGRPPSDEFIGELKSTSLADAPPLATGRLARAGSSWQTWYPLATPYIEALYGKVCIIIVTWNNRELTQQCLASVLADQTWPNYQVVVVDNASSDGTVEFLKVLSEKESRVRLVLNSTNVGFAAANNIGLRQAQASEFVVFLNNDTVVPPGWLPRLLRHARQSEVGMVGPVTNWTGNEAKIDVDYRDLEGMEAFARGYTHAHEGRVFDIRVLAMYCVAMRKSVIDQIGPLDERFGVGMFEDDDYARRVRQAGFRVICAEDVFVHHRGMASFSKMATAEYHDLFERNKRLYEEKWGEPWVPYQARES